MAKGLTAQLELARYYYHLFVGSLLTFNRGPVKPKELSVLFWCLVQWAKDIKSQLAIEQVVKSPRYMEDRFETQSK